MRAMSDDLQSLLRLQKWRGGRFIPGVTSLESEWKRIGAQVARDHKRVGRVVEAWEVCIPEEIRRDCRVDGYSRGVLTVAVASAPARYAVDRLLRTGAEARLRQLLGTAFQRVRLVAVAMDDGEAPVPERPSPERGQADSSLDDGTD